MHGVHSTDLRRAKPDDVVFLVFLDVSEGTSPRIDHHLVLGARAELRMSEPHSCSELDLRYADVGNLGGEHLSVRGWNAVGLCLRRDDQNFFGSVGRLEQPASEPIARKRAECSLDPPAWCCDLLDQILGRRVVDAEN